MWREQNPSRELTSCTECQNHLVITECFLPFSNLMLFCPAVHIHSRQLQYSRASMSFVTVLHCLFPNTKYTWSHLKKFCHRCLVCAAPLASSCLSASLHCRSANKPYAFLSREQWEQKALRNFHFECRFIERICQGELPVKNPRECSWIRRSSL